MIASELKQAHYEVHYIQYTLFSVLFSVHFIQYTLFSTLHSIHCIQYTLFSTLYSVHFIQYTSLKPSTSTWVLNLLHQSITSLFSIYSREKTVLSVTITYWAVLLSLPYSTLYNILSHNTDIDASSTEVLSSLAQNDIVGVPRSVCQLFQCIIPNDYSVQFINCWVISSSHYSVQHQWLFSVNIFHIPLKAGLCNLPRVSVAMFVCILAGLFIFRHREIL